MYKCILLIVVMVVVCIFISFFSKNKHEYPLTFKELYKKEKNILHYQFDELMGCMNIKPLYNCMEKDIEIYKTKYSKNYYMLHPFNLSFYEDLNLNYDVLVAPKKLTIANVVIVIPISPTQLQPRIAIRNTYAKIKKYSHYMYKYIFVMGKPDECDDNNRSCYPFNYIEEENRMFDDILVFNYTNSYKLITLQLLLCYKFILKSYKYMKYVVRANSDMFIKSDLLGKLLTNYKSYDIIGYKVLYKKKIVYPCGSFYVFSKNFIQLIVEKYKFVKPIHDIEDVYYGQIMKQYKITNVKWTNNEDIYISLWQYNFKDIYLKKSFVSIHELPSSVIIYLWRHYYHKEFHYYF